jgi:hypothetical protein
VPLLVAVPLLVGVAQGDHLGDVEHGAVGVLLNGVVDGRLQAVLDDHQVGVGECGGAGEGRLDVVRLDAGVGEADDVHPVAADPLRDPGQGVEARGDVHQPVVGGVVGQRAAGGEGQDEEQEGETMHENDSQCL